MKRKSSKTMIDLAKQVTIVHFNVDAGYVTYLQRDGTETRPKVKAIVLQKQVEAAK